MQLTTFLLFAHVEAYTDVGAKMFENNYHQTTFEPLNQAICDLASLQTEDLMI